MTVRLLAPALVAAAALMGCRRERGGEQIEFPATPVLAVRSTWAVVISPLLRVREEPSSSSTVLQHIRKGVVVEVIARSDRPDTIEDETDWWYRINYDGLTGWVFGPYLGLYDSRSRAEEEAADLR